MGESDAQKGEAPPSSHLCNSKKINKTSGAFEDEEKENFRLLMSVPSCQLANIYLRVICLYMLPV